MSGPSGVDFNPSTSHKLQPVSPCLCSGNVFLDIEISSSSVKPRSPLPTCPQKVSYTEPTGWSLIRATSGMSTDEPDPPLVPQPFFCRHELLPSSFSLFRLKTKNLKLALLPCGFLIRQAGVFMSLPDTGLLLFLDQVTKTFLARFTVRSVVHTTFLKTTLQSRVCPYTSVASQR